MHGKHIQLLLYYRVSHRLGLTVERPAGTCVVVVSEMTMCCPHPRRFGDSDLPLLTDWSTLLVTAVSGPRLSSFVLFMSTDTLTSIPLLELRCDGCGGGVGGRMKRIVVHYTPFRFVCAISIWIKVFFKLMFLSNPSKNFSRFIVFKSKFWTVVCSVPLKTRFWYFRSQKMPKIQFLRNKH